MAIMYKQFVTQLNIITYIPVSPRGREPLGPEAPTTSPHPMQTALIDTVSPTAGTTSGASAILLTQAA